MSKRETSHTENMDAVPRRPTIALLTYGIVDTISQSLWAGMEDVAREREINLISISGGTFHDFTGVSAPANVLYGLVSAEELDGLVIWDALTHHISTEETEMFYERYAALPRVSVGLPLPHIPTVVVDNYQGMHSLVTHLVEEHGYRRIAFICGPEGHSEAEDRYRAYQHVLAEHDITFDPQLVTPGNNQRSGGEQAVQLLLDERGLQPRMDIQALVAANDNMALGALSALQAREVRMPEELALVGFDDFEEGAYVTPSLTSVPWPGYAQGRQAAELLVSMLEGQEVPMLTRVPTKVIVRESCGCLNPAIVQAAVRPGTRALSESERSLSQVLGMHRAEILAAILASEASLQDIAELVEEMLDAFVLELTRGAQNVFVPTLQKILKQPPSSHGPVTLWHDVISALRRAVLDYLEYNDELMRAENLWQQARVLISHTVQQTYAREAWQVQTLSDTLRTVGQALMTSSDVGDLMHVLQEYLTWLDIPGCYVVLQTSNDDNENITIAENTQTSELILAYDSRRSDPIISDGLEFPAHRLLPERILPTDRRYSLVVESLYVRDERFGHILFEIGPRDGAIYGVLRGQISSALQSALLLEQTRQTQVALEQAYQQVEQQVADRTAELQREIAERETLYERRAMQVQTSTLISQEIAASSTLDALYNRVVTLIKERFDYYYVQIFRYDPVNKLLRLVSGYGEVGKNMLAQGYQVSIGQGLIGAAAETGATVLTPDVRKDHRWRSNPHMPDTQGELVVPIKLRGQVLGALDVQSDRPGMLGADDQLLLEQLCGQIAVSIESTSLQAEMEERLRALDTLQRAMAREGWDVLRARRQAAKGYFYDQAQGQVRPLDHTPSEDSQTFAVPVAVQQDEVVGKLGVRQDPQRPLTQEERALLASLSDQVASALDRARLFEDTRRSAARDQLISELSTRMRESLEVDAVLRTTVHDITEALGFARVEVRLGVEDSDTPRDGDVEAEL